MTHAVFRTQPKIEVVDVMPPFNRCIPLARTYPDEKVKQIVRNLATNEARNSGSKVVKPIHVLLALFSILLNEYKLTGEIVLRNLFGQEPDGVESFLRAEQQPIRINPFEGNIQLSKEVQRIFKKTRNNYGYIGLLLNILKSKDPDIREIRKTFGITDEKINREYRRHFRVPEVIPLRR